MFTHDDQTYAIIGAAMNVHKSLGSGFLEAVYQEALQREFEYLKIPFERERCLRIYYRGNALETSYRVDFLCYDSVLVELKAIVQMGKSEEAQIINYLNASRLNRGLLINFGSKSLEHKRFVHNYSG